MRSETSEAVETTWEHAQLEFQKFLKIRIPLLCIPGCLNVQTKPTRFNVDIFGIPHPNNLTYGSRLKNDSKKTDVRNIWRTLHSCQANMLYS